MKKKLQSLAQIACTITIECGCNILLFGLITQCMLTLSTRLCTLTTLTLCKDLELWGCTVHWAIGCTVYPEPASKNYAEGFAL